MKNRITALVLVFTIIVSFSGCGSQKEESVQNKTNKKITVVLDWTPNTNHTGLYVAQNKGYYEEAGLDVEIAQPPEDGATALVASGKAQFGIDFQDYLIPALVGEDKLPVTAVAALVQHNTSGIISLKEKGITSPKEMEHHNYATWNLPIEQEMLREIMKEDGGNFDNVELIPSTVTDEVSALKSNIDSIWVYYGWAGIATEVAGLDTNFYYFKDIDDTFDYYSPVLIANNDFLDRDPETAKAFLAATAKGYEDAIENPKEAADILCEAVPELDTEQVAESQKWLANQYKAEVEQWGYIDAARWNKFYRWINEKNLASAAIEDNTGFSNDYLPE